MNLRKTLNDAHNALLNAKIDHALIGGFALAAYGIHRTTSDIDFLADGTKVHEIKSSLMSAGFKLIFETSEVLHFAGNGSLDILLANRPLSQKMLQNLKINTELNIHLVQKEDLIGLKIQAYKNDKTRELQDKADIQSLLRTDNLDLKKVKEYADLFGEWPTIELLKK